MNHTGAAFGRYEVFTTECHDSTPATKERFTRNVPLKEILASFEPTDWVSPYGPSRMRCLPLPCGFLSPAIQPPGLMWPGYGARLAIEQGSSIYIALWEPREATPQSGDFPLREPDSPHGEQSPSPTSPVANAVDQAVQRLGLPKEYVFDITGIASSTYYHWKRQPASFQPRLASQGRLWELMDFLDDLEELIDVPVSTWILGRPGRLDLLTEGRFSALLEDLHAPRRSSSDDAEYLANYAVGAEADRALNSQARAPRQPFVKKGASPKRKRK